MSEDKKRRISFFRVANLAALLVTIISLFLTVVAVFWTEYYPFTRAPTQRELEAESLRGLGPNRFEDELNQLKADINALSKLPSSNPVNLALKEFEIRLDSLSNRIGKFERIVSNDSTRVLEVAVMNRDISDIEERLNLNQSTIRDELDRMYAQNNWFIGIMITTLLSLVGLVVANLGKQQSRKAE